MVGSKITSAYNTSSHPEDQHRHPHACSNSNISSSSSKTTFATKASATNVTRLAICLVVLLSLLEVTNAQNVHFSNGWYPGKKRSSSSSSVIPGAASSPLIAPAASTSSGSPGAFSTCSIRPDLGEIINKVIMEEMVRLHSSCLFGIPRDLREILEGTASKQTKW